MNFLNDRESGLTPAPFDNSDLSAGFISTLSAAQLRAHTRYRVRKRNFQRKHAFRGFTTTELLQMEAASALTKPDPTLSGMSCAIHPLFQKDRWVGLYPLS